MAQNFHGRGAPAFSAKAENAGGFSAPRASPPGNAGGPFLKI